MESWHDFLLKEFKRQKWIFSKKTKMTYCYCSYHLILRELGLKVFHQIGLENLKFR